MKKVIKLIGIMLVVISMFIFTACSMFNNEEFTYMAEGGIMKISIQSTRDKSYKFTVTDKDAVKEIYRILSKAKVVGEKTSIEPDYTFEIHVSPTDVRTFNYIAGLDKNEVANFYSDTQNFIVSKRLDNDIIKNFSNIRKPIDFDEVYYNTIINAIQTYNKGDIKSKKIGINIGSDIEVAKFQLSLDIENFKNDLKNIPNVELIEGNSKKEDYDIVLNVKTQGYTSTRYKSILTFQTKGNEKPVQYYCFNKYEQGNWNISITEEKPKGF